MTWKANCGSTANKKDWPRLMVISWRTSNLEAACWDTWTREAILRSGRQKLQRATWEMAVMTVDMKGKALLFKTINVQQTETRSDFQRVPDDLTLTQAADILSGQIVVAENR